MNCSGCGLELRMNARFCGSCGAAAAVAPRQPVYEGQSDGRRGSSPARYAEGKNPILALVLSLVIVGAGQLYNGDWKKAILMLVGAVIGGFLSFSLLWWIMALWSAVDAYRVASGAVALWL